MRLILVRHGHVEGIDPPRFRGRGELPLTALGERQIAATARRVSAEWKVDAVYSSPIGRAVRTGQAIADRFGLTVQSLPSLVDFDYGDWSWRTHEEVRSEARSLYDRWFSAPHTVRVPGGDTLQTLAARVGDALREMLVLHPNGTVVATAHDSTNRAILLQLLDLPLSGYWRIRQDPCCVNEIDVGGVVQIRRLNETWHLADLAAAPGS